MSDYLALVTQAQEMNRETLVTALREQGVTVATVDYAGAGDSGDTCDLAVQPPELRDGLSAIRVKQHEVDVQYLGYSQRACAMRETEVPLDEAVRDFAMRMVDGLYGGWEINEGACGTVTIHVNDNAILLEHTSYYTESETHEHAL